MCQRKRRMFAILRSIVYLFIFLDISFALGKPEAATQELGDWQCLSQVQIDEIQRDFKIYLFPGFEWTDISRCDQTGTTYKVIQALLFLKYTKYETISPRSDGGIQGFFSEQKPFEFFKSQVKEIRFTSCPNVEVTKTLAYVDWYANPLFVCVNNTANKDPLQYAATMIHEARHIGNNKTPHILCTKNAARGSACDDDPSGSGAYNYEVEYLNTVFKYALNILPETRQSARNYSLMSLYTVFNKPISMKSDEALVLRNQNDEIFILTANPNLKITNTGRRIQGRIFDSNFGGGLLVYDEKDKKFATTTIYGDGPWFPDALTLVYNNVSYAEKDVVRDFFPSRSSRWCMIEGTKLRYGYRPQWQQRTSALPTAETYRCLKPALCDRSEDTKSIFVQSESGRSFQVSFVGERSNDTATFEEIYSCEKDVQFTAQLQDLKFVINKRGQLLQYKNDQWSPVSSVSSQKFNFMSDPMVIYEFFKQSINGVQK